MLQECVVVFIDILVWYDIVGAVPEQPTVGVWGGMMAGLGVRTSAE
jgi:hypothetical protein